MEAPYHIPDGFLSTLWVAGIGGVLPLSPNPVNILAKPVAHAPSNVKDAAAGKSFIFITIVVRNAVGTLLRAAYTLACTRHVSLLLTAISAAEPRNPKTVKHPVTPASQDTSPPFSQLGVSTYL